MNTLNKQKTAITVGVFIASFHLLWSLIVALGIGQMVYDFILWMHMIHVPITIGPFDITAMMALLLLTFIMGYIFGWIFAYLWNMLHRPSKTS